MIDESIEHLLTGKELVKFIVEYLKLEKQKDSFKMLKTTIYRGNLCRIYIIRSKPFEDLLNILSKKAKVCVLSSQHDIVKAFLAPVLLNADLSNLEVRNEYESLIDIVKELIGYELKTKNNLDHTFIKGFISEYFQEMIALHL